MSNAALFRLELRETLRQPLTWIVLALLAAAMLAGCAVGAARVAAERAALAEVTDEARVSVEEAKATARRYAAPAQLEVAQFRDPSDAFGYMYNFLTVYATRVPAPLAAVTVGQSDLTPPFIRVNFANVFPDSGYELRSPRMLALGAFDLGFVLVYLVPLAVIALGGTRLAGEQDSGILRMIAAQPVAPRQVAAVKFLALAAVTVPFIATVPLLALWSTGGIGTGSSAAMLSALAILSAAYACFWIAMCALAASLWRGSVAALAMLVLSWATMTVLLPSLAALLLDLAAPAPSRLAYVDASRVAADREAMDKGAAADWFDSRHDLGWINPNPVFGPELARLARDQHNRAALLPLRQAFEGHAARLQDGSTVARLVSPALVLDGALQHLAGTDGSRQQAYVHAADGYTQHLRRWFERRVVAALGKPPRCPDCPGRLSFREHDRVPAFRASIPAPDPAPLAWAIGYLAVAVLAVASLAYRRLQRWPL
ncbi:ABC transporter permease subunit [Sphingomonas sp. PL-96]|uniref:ABC transporter permease subunit n=1 Tax=Sphingomonas sp. PL-96 TaxID=2887201 RepID=UPI001E2EE5E7|nr:ABC transporter permease subunit [Sphingomonas sp. PL-96]MCC2978337.1 ABC transporter permease subunit [Sphingomonas sp. PL-96]